MVLKVFMFPLCSQNVLAIHKFEVIFLFAGHLFVPNINYIYRGHLVFPDASVSTVINFNQGTDIHVVVLYHLFCNRVVQ